MPIRWLRAKALLNGEYSTLHLVDVDKVRELWVDKFNRAIIMPLTAVLILVSLYIYVRKWFFPITDEVEVEGEKLVYYKPKSLSEVGLDKFNNIIASMELIGHISEGISETISARIWLRNVEDKELDNVVREIYRELSSFLRRRFEESLSG